MPKMKPVNEEPKCFFFFTVLSREDQTGDERLNRPHRVEKRPCDGVRFKGREVERSGY